MNTLATLFGLFMSAWFVYYLFFELDQNLLGFGAIIFMGWHLPMLWLAFEEDGWNLWG